MGLWCLFLICYCGFGVIRDVQSSALLGHDLNIKHFLVHLTKLKAVTWNTVWVSDIQIMEIMHDPEWQWQFLVCTGKKTGRHTGRVLEFWRSFFCSMVNLELVHLQLSACWYSWTMLRLLTPCFILLFGMTWQRQLSSLWAVFSGPTGSITLSLSVPVNRVLHFFLSNTWCG